MSRVTLEIGTEAIPAGYVPPALEELESRARAGLGELRLAAASVRTAGTAHRLVLEIEGLAERQEDLTREVTGPRADIAFRDGKPTKAAEGFARKNGVPVEALGRVTTEKGEFVAARVHETGRPARDVLPDFLTGLVNGLDWPKTMRWNGGGFRFPRPVRWVVSLLDDEVLALTWGGLAAGRETRGHRLVAPGEHPVGSADRLDEVLESVGVVLDPSRRREGIVRELEAGARRLGGRWVRDEGLLDEVVFLAELPAVFSGSFDPGYLELPREVVVTAMRSHQRYFAVENERGELMANFLVVCDGRWDDPGQVVAGNERVLRARLEDARFYWRVDMKTGLERLSESLGKVVWLESVGSVREKAERVEQLVDELGTRWHPAEWPARREAALRAARLAKADLASEMIRDGKEFTGLQGVIGARYAEAQGEPEAVRAALAEQYRPRGASDPLPESLEGTLVAFADRVDTVAGCWAAGFVPSGSQDPYGLRRAANGMIRILLEKKLHVSLEEVVTAAADRLPDSALGNGKDRESIAARRTTVRGEVLDFLRDRTATFLRERGLSHDEVEAVLAADADDPLDALARGEALHALRGREELERLVIGFKRAANILKGVDEGGLPSPDAAVWEGAHPTERLLHETTVRLETGLVRARRGKDYPAMLRNLLELREPIDRFFDDVLVMSEDPAERERRLALLAEARGLFGHFFDPARIVIEGETS
jgi:glycyl-tRNA synthetase beta chain